MDAGALYALAPWPDATHRSLHRIDIVFAASDGRRRTAGTELMATTENSLIGFTDRLNASLDLYHKAWNTFAERVFATNPYRKSESGGEPSALPK